MTYLTLSNHSDGISVGSGNHVVYDIVNNRAHFGAHSVDSHALVFSLGGTTDTETHMLSAKVDLSGSDRWLMRCDRIDFPPGGIAYLHTHPGPGIRCQLFGELTVTSAGHTGTYSALEPWFEAGPDPVYAEASPSESGAFVRVLVLPVEWAGKRTIRYVDPEDENKPKLQKATVYLEEEVLV